MMTWKQGLGLIRRMLQHHATGAVPPTPPSSYSNAEALWKFNELPPNHVDEIAARVLVSNGGQTSGVEGGAIVVSGTEYAYCDEYTTGWDPAQDMTFRFWVQSYWDDYVPNMPLGFYDKADLATTHGKNFCVFVSSTNASVFLSQQGGGQTGVTFNYDEIPAGTWKALTFTYDATTKELKLYVNDTLIDTKDLSAVTNPEVFPFVIAYSDPDNRPDFAFDLVAIWRRKMELAEISDLFNNEYPT